MDSFIKLSHVSIKKGANGFILLEYCANGNRFWVQVNLGHM